MGKQIPRNEMIRNLKDKVARGEPIVGCGAGTGISAKFEEAGGAFDPEMAGKLEKHILSAGVSEEADVLYTKFRGKMPGVDALLRGRGLAG